MVEGMDALTYRRMEKAVRYLDEHQGAQPTLEDVARYVGLSPHHLQRLFRGAVGVSPKRFLQFATAARARGLLDGEENLLAAAWGAGLSGPGRLHDLMVNVHAMTPAEVRARGRGVELRWGVVDAPLGPMVLAASPRGISALEWLEEGTRSEALARLSARWPRARLAEDAEHARAWAARLFPTGPGGAPPEAAGPVSLHVRGTNFQIRVWEALLAIPEGGVDTYGGVARRLGASPAASRAVGQAVGANPVAWIIPCHRVLRATGALGGYRWGADRKLLLLARELA